MATLTGPQLEVIALLAEATPLAEIAAKQGGTVDDVHDHIWSACRAVGAKDRINLVAIAFRARLLHVPGVPAAFPEGSAEHLSAELDRTIEAAAAARSEARAARSEAEQAIANARNAQTLAERKLATARNDLAEEVEKRESAERQLLLRTPGPSWDVTNQLEQLRAQIVDAQQAAAAAGTARAAAEAELARVKAAPSATQLQAQLAEAQQAAARARTAAADAKASADAAEAARARANGEASRLREQTTRDAATINGLQQEIERIRTAKAAKAPQPVQAGDREAVQLVQEATVQWLLNQLAQLARQAREGAQRAGSTQAPRFDLVEKANALQDAGVAIAAAWRRRIDQRPKGAATRA